MEMLQLLYGRTQKFLMELCKSLDKDALVS